MVADSNYPYNIPYIVFLNIPFATIDLPFVEIISRFGGYSQHSYSLQNIWFSTVQYIIQINLLL